MTEFKCGDRIWTVCVYNSFHREEGEVDISIMAGIVERANESEVFAVDSRGCEITDKNHDNYPTREDAIDAVIFELQRLKDKRK